MMQYRKLKKPLGEGDAGMRVEEEPFGTEVIEELEHEDSEDANAVV